MTTAAHLRLLTTHARTAGRVSDGAGAEPPQGAEGTEGTTDGRRARGRRAKRAAGAGRPQREADPAADNNAVAVCRHEQRRVRLVANAQAFARLEEVIRLVACAYRLRVNWLGDVLGDGSINESADRPEAVELRTIAARLAPARQIALVVGDPERHTVWISQCPFLQALERVRTAPVPLERVCCPADEVDDECLIIEHSSCMTSRISLLISSRTERLMRDCGPVGRALVAQSNAVLALAPRVADCPAQLRDCRYVLAAPTGFARLRDSAALTNWAERLLCLSLGAARDLDTLAAGADMGLAERMLLGSLTQARQVRQLRAPALGVRR